MTTTEKELRNIKPGTSIEWTCPGNAEKRTLIVNELCFIGNIARLILDDGDWLKAYPSELKILK